MSDGARREQTRIVVSLIEAAWSTRGEERDRNNRILQLVNVSVWHGEKCLCQMNESFVARVVYWLLLSASSMSTTTCELTNEVATTTTRERTEKKSRIVSHYLQWRARVCVCSHGNVKRNKFANALSFGSGNYFKSSFFGNSASISDSYRRFCFFCFSSSSSLSLFHSSTLSRLLLFHYIRIFFGITQLSAVIDSLVAYMSDNDK